MRRKTFRELGAEVEQRARMLAFSGIGANEPVILCGPGGADWIIACLAILRSGACAVPVGNQFTTETFKYVVKDLGVRCALVASSARNRFGASLEESAIEVFPIDDDVEFVS